MSALRINYTLQNFKDITPVFILSMCLYNYELHKVTMLILIEKSNTHLSVSLTSCVNRLIIENRPSIGETGAK